MKVKLSAKLVALTQPTIEMRIPNAEGFIAFCARVSNPDNQNNFDTTEKLLSYCIKKKHWSVFEMVDAVVEIEAPRDISRQLLRHGSFRFQEFSQRYSDQISFTQRDFRSQDLKNRQNSVDDLDPVMQYEASNNADYMADAARVYYKGMLERGVAKECARVILPEGLTMSRLYMKGSLRSWIHYLEVREEEGVTQLEHVKLANLIREAIKPAFPKVFNMLEKTT